MKLYIFLFFILIIPSALMAESGMSIVAVGEADVERERIFLEEPKIDNISKALEKWPKELPKKRNWRTQILGQIYERLLFLYYEENNMYDARYCWLRLLQFAPSKLRNRGTL